MPKRNNVANGEGYHVFNRSIADFKIFRDNNDFLRMKNTIRYYKVSDMPLRISKFIESESVKKYGFNKQFIKDSHGKEEVVRIIAYCIMPTHLHLVLIQLKEGGISKFMQNILNSYSRYFNTKYKRRGPLWESRFKTVAIKSDEQLLHLTRYIHLNPVTASLCDKPGKWAMSSYPEYVSRVNRNSRVCEYDNVLEIVPSMYKEFVEDRMAYQRELAKIMKLTFDEAQYTPGVYFDNYSNFC